LSNARVDAARGAQHDAAMIAEDISEKRARRKFAADAT
jgi:hypothetical protein